MEFSIRDAIRSDVDHIHDILRRAFASYQPLYTTGGYASTVPSAQELADRMGVVETLVAEYGEICIATVGIQRTRKGIYIQSMAVDPDYRGLGAAKRMLEYIEALARDSGIRRLYLCTTPFLREAISLYESVGFVRIPDSEHDLHTGRCGRAWLLWPLPVGSRLSAFPFCRGCCTLPISTRPRCYF